VPEKYGNEKLSWISLRRRLPEADLKSGRYGSSNILLYKTNKLSLSVRSEIGGPRYEVLNKHEVHVKFLLKKLCQTPHISGFFSPSGRDKHPR
jgi:hypothetical protein